jgi:hypothetical protein
MLETRKIVSAAAALVCLALAATGSEAQRPGEAARGPDLRQQSEEKLRRAIEQEEKEKAAEAKRAAQEAGRAKSEAEEKSRLDRLEQEKEAKREREKREAQCVVKPVMTDDEIEKCRRAYR